MMKKIVEKKLAALRKGSNKILATLAVLTLAALPAKAQSLSGLDLGTAGNYAFIHIGSGTLGWNSGPIAGDVIFGQGLDVSMSGGNNGGLSNGGILYYDNTTTLGGSLENPPTTQLVPTTLTQQVADDALSVSTYANSLTATQTFGTLDGGSVTGNGGLNVIAADIIKKELTITGTSDDFFVFNVSDVFDSNEAMILLGGITSDRILFNLTGTGTVFKTAGGNDLKGTFLSTNGGSFQFSNLVLEGALINTGGGDVQFVSGSSIPTFEPLIVPEPSSAILLGLGLAGTLLRRKR